MYSIEQTKGHACDVGTTSGIVVDYIQGGPSTLGPLFVDSMDKSCKKKQSLVVGILTIRVKSQFIGVLV